MLQSSINSHVPILCKKKKKKNTFLLSFTEPAYNRAARLKSLDTFPNVNNNFSVCVTIKTNKAFLTILCHLLSYFIAKHNLISYYKYWSMQNTQGIGWNLCTAVLGTPTRFAVPNGASEDGASLLSASPEERTRTDGWKLRESGFWLIVRRNFLTARVAQEWNYGLRRWVASPSLEVSKQKVDRHLSGMLWSHPPLQIQLL